MEYASHKLVPAHLRAFIRKLIVKPKVFPVLDAGLPAEKKIIELTGPPGVGKSYLFERLALGSANIKVNPRGFSRIALDDFRRYLHNEKSQRSFDQKNKIMSRLAVDAYLCSLDIGKAFLFDEHVVHSFRAEIGTATRLEIPGVDSFFKQRLVVVIEDDPKNVAEKVVLRHKTRGHLWIGHQKKSENEIVAYSEDNMRRGRRLFELLVSKGFDCIVLNAQDGVDHMIDRILSYHEFSARERVSV